MSINMIVSKVTRNSVNADVLREACKVASEKGLAFSIVETFTNNDWWTEYSIERPITQVYCNLDQITMPAFDMTGFEK